MFHFAGGNCYSFDFLKPHLRDFEIVTPELPGRGRRINETLIRDFDQAALDLYSQMARRLTFGSFIIYGHSMGAYLGLRVVSLLEQQGLSPSYLIVSGNPGPGAVDDGSAPVRHLMERSRFADELALLGGTPRELIENDDLFNYIEPILRADFQVAERNALADEPPVNCPLHAIMGSLEENTEAIDNWGRYTAASFTSQLLDGDHFFIRRHPHEIAGIIRKCHLSAHPEASF